MNFDIINFLKGNSFFQKNEDIVDIHHFLKQNSDDKLGTDIIMYYFNFEGYTISFVYDMIENKLKAEQIEINNSATTVNNILTEIIPYKYFINRFKNDISEIYEDEKVIFMKSGVNVFFNIFKKEFYITKITSSDVPSRELAKSIMTKIELL